MTDCECGGVTIGTEEVSVRIEFSDRKPIAATATAAEIRSRFPIVRVVSDPNADGYCTGETVCIPRALVSIESDLS
jgi:hypothetical protein